MVDLHAACFHFFYPTIFFRIVLETMNFRFLGFFVYYLTSCLSFFITLYLSHVIGETLSRGRASLYQPFVSGFENRAM